MNCLTCGGKTEVQNTYTHAEVVVRVRRCLECGTKLRTEETRQPVKGEAHAA